MYIREKEFIINLIKNSYTENLKKGASVRAKSAYDVVTDLDCNIEKQIVAAIKKNYPDDLICGEEFSSKNSILEGRVWTVDPIDGTVNMACGLPLFGVQCSLIEEEQPVLGVIYYPYDDSLIFAVKGDGCYYVESGKDLSCAKKTTVKAKPLTHAVVSFCDFSHVKLPVAARRQYTALGSIYNKISKVRMFGAGCWDFASLALGKTDGVVMITKNLWDLAPGLVICREAGAIISNLNGEEYSFSDDGMLLGADNEVLDLLVKAFN